MTHRTGRPAEARQTRPRYPARPDTATLAYLRRRRKKRRKAGGEAFSMLSLGTPTYGWEPGDQAGAEGGGWAVGGGAVSRIYERVVGTAHDLVQLSIPQQSAELIDGGKRWARMATGESMVAVGLTLPTVCSILGVYRVAGGGVDAATDAIFTLDNGGGKSVALQAGDAVEFLGDLVGAGTGIPTVADFLTDDIADDSAQFIAAELNQTTNVISLLQNNQVRKIDTGLTGTLDGIYDLTIGGAIDMDFGWLYIFDGELDLVAYLHAANYAAAYGASIVADEWASRFTALPALSGSAVVDEELTTTDGETVNLRNAANSRTYGWRAETAGLIYGETANTYTIDAELEGDKVRSEVNNTVLGQTVIGASAYTDTIIDEITPADIGSMVTWYDASDEATITETGGIVSQVDDKIGSNHIISVTGSPETGNATYDQNGLNGIHIPLSDNLRTPDIASLGTSVHFFYVTNLLDINGDGAATLLSLQDSAGRRDRMNSHSTLNFQPRLGDVSPSTHSNATASDIDRAGLALWDVAYDDAADTATVYYNGMQVAQANDYSSGAAWSGTLFFWFAEYLGSLNPTEQVFYEFCISAGVVGGTDITNLRAALFGKWGITP